ncbi:MAG: histidinol-phosphatase HisJ family protein [Catonella sp.]|uniref:histidinol-phosphatase HisJ family protein n=1 Tax=Catonella sp. TaxID=2382125 RepID=UPI003FA0C8CE
MIIADMHTHSAFSGDSEVPIETQLEKAIALGLKHYCLTEHEDLYYPETVDDSGNSINIFKLDLPDYLNKINKLKTAYKNKINILTGIELGLCERALPEYKKLINEHNFDFVIASVHLIDGFDPYYPEFWLYHDRKAAITRYFEIMLEMITKFTDFDALGHLDYIFRYIRDEAGNPTDGHYSYREYADLIDPILMKIIELDKALEINSAGYKYGLESPNPRSKVIKRYKKLGGKKITIGSDGHQPEHLAYDFDKCETLLKELEFDGYYIYENRKPIKINF